MFLNSSEEEDREILNVAPGWEAGLRPSGGWRLTLGRLVLSKASEEPQAPTAPASECHCRAESLFPPQPPRPHSLAADGNLLLQLPPAFKTSKTGDMLLLRVCDLHSDFWVHPNACREHGARTPVSPLGWRHATAEGSKYFTFLLEFFTSPFKLSPLCGK